MVSLSAKALDKPSTPPTFSHTELRVCQIIFISSSSICCFVGCIPYVDHTSRLASSAVYVLTISFRFADAFMFIIVAMSM